jgi:O-antigen ligase
MLNPIGTAEVSSISILSAIALAEKFPRGRTLFVAASILLFGVILLSRSRGPLAALILALGAYVFARFPVRKAGIAAAAGFWFGAMVFLVFGDELPRLVLLGRTDDVSTLTGRLPVWTIVIDYAHERPIAGYGYNSFWTVGRFNEIASYTNFNVADVHNSYLGMLLGLGYPGVLLWCAVLFGAIFRSARLFRRTGNHFYCFACAALVFHASDAILLSVFLAEQFSSFLILVILMKIVMTASVRTAGWRVQNRFA